MKGILSVSQSQSQGSKLQIYTKSLLTLQQMQLLCMQDALEESDMIRGIFRNEVNFSVIEM